MFKEIPLRTRIIRLSMVFVTITLFSGILIEGCMPVNLTAEGVKKSVLMNSIKNKQFTVIKHFSDPLKGWFTLFNLITISNPNVQKDLKNEIANSNGDAVINVEIHGETNFIDALIPVAIGIIGGIVAPPYGYAVAYLIGARTYTVEGDVIKYINKTSNSTNKQ